MITGRRVVIFLWIIAGGLITAGTAFWTIPGALIIAGFLIITGTVTMVDIDDRKPKRDPRTLRRVPRGGGFEGDNPPRMFPAPDQRKVK